MALVKTNRMSLSGDRGEKDARRVKDCFDQYFIVSLFFLLCLLVVLPCLLIAALWRVSHEKRRKFVARIINCWLQMGRKVGVLEISVLQPEVFKNLRGTIVTSNHPSLIDAIILLSLLPNAACVMRGGISNDKLLGSIARLLAYVSNDEGRIMIREGSKILKEGGNLLIFPEGTRTRHQAVEPFKKGFALLSVRMGFPIHTVIIERQGNYLSKDIPLFYPAKLPLYYRIQPGMAMTAEPDESAKELAIRVENYYLEALEYRGDEIFLKSNLSFFSCDAIKS